MHEMQNLYVWLISLAYTILLWSCKDFEDLYSFNIMSFITSYTMQAEVLYKLIEDSACLKGDGSEIVLDLFCGTGTIGLTLAKR